MIIFSRAGLASPTIPHLVLSDLLEVVTLARAEELFSVVEENVATFKEERFYTQGKNYLLRLCNGENH